MPHAFSGGNASFPAKFLESPEGVPVKKGLLTTAPVVSHNPRDIHAAQNIAANAHTDREPLGLIYYNPDVPTYHEVRYNNVPNPDRATKAKILEKYLDRYTVGAADAVE